MSAKPGICLDITNIYAKGDYTATLYIGEHKSPVNLILDSGSSTLVVHGNKYDAEHDNLMQPGVAAQEVNYGIGGWAGPVVHTRVALGNEDKDIALNNAPIALALTEKSQTFAAADGMLGLAYHHLNKSFDLSSYISQNNIQPAHTYPWVFNGEDGHPNSDSLKTFKSFLWQYPEHDITPYFTDLQQHGLVANKFAFLTHRSSVYVAESENANNEDAHTRLAQQPLNHGKLILGAGEEYHEFYTGDFKHLRVDHDVYYNVNLVSMRIGDAEQIQAAPLAPEHQANYYSNAIVDTGASAIVFTQQLFDAMVDALHAQSTEFTRCIAPFKDLSAQETGIDASELDLSLWPSIYLTFKSDEGKSVELEMSPQTYWQVNAPTPGKATFKILSQLPNWPNQSILGLPLLNNYYVVFDRAEHQTGCVKFANKK